jgi:hypothetical protein
MAFFHFFSPFLADLICPDVFISKAGKLLPVLVYAEPFALHRVILAKRPIALLAMWDGLAVSVA